MARPLRLDEQGLTHHITQRGNERKRIYRDDADCTKFLQLLEETVRHLLNPLLSAEVDLVGDVVPDGGLVAELLTQGLAIDLLASRRDRCGSLRGSSRSRGTAVADRSRRSSDS